MSSRRVFFIGRSLALIVALAGGASAGLALAQPSTGSPPMAATKAVVEYSMVTPESPVSVKY